jgi:hypothetical protein
MPGAKLRLAFAPLLALVALLALPAAANAWFEDDFADAYSSPPAGTSSDWVEYFGADLASATKEPGEPDHAGYPGGHSVWLSWKMYHDQVVEAHACGKSVEELVAVYTGTAVDQLTEVASNAEGNSNGCTVVRFEAKAGTTYRIAVDAKADPGSISFFMRRLPPNDDFADAVVLDEFPTAEGVDPRIATTESGEPDHPANGEGNSVWYRWTPVKSGLATVSNCEYWSGANFAVYTGSAIDALTEVAAGKGGGGDCGNAGEARFDAVAGTTYMISVEGYPGKDGYLGVYFGWVGKRLLAVRMTGSGQGMVYSNPAGVECGRDCEASFYKGPAPYEQTTVGLVAVPAPGSVFTGWSGEGCSGIGSCTLTMEGPAGAVSANFAAVEPALPQPGAFVAPLTPPRAAQAVQTPRPKKARCRRKAGGKAPRAQRCARKDAKPLRGKLWSARG